jgi:alpha-galactosidase
LKFGIHIMRGFPKQALYPGFQTKEGKLVPTEISDPTSTCVWLNHMVGARTDHPSGQAYYDSLFRLYASWGVDFVKIDDIAFPYRAAEIEMMDRARQRCGRPMTLSLSPGACDFAQSAHVRQHAEMWRLSPDFWDRWEDIVRAFTLCQQWAGERAPGCWPDPDMIPIGRLSRRGPVGPDRDSFLTVAEQRTLLALWALFRAPHFLGGDLTVMDRATIELIAHPALARIRRETTPATCLALDGRHSVWTAPRSGGAGGFVGVFNLSEETLTYELTPADLAALGSAPALRDAWTGRPLSGRQITLAPHDAALIEA